MSGVCCSVCVGMWVCAHVLVCVYMHIVCLQGSKRESGITGDKGEPGEIGPPGKKVKFILSIHIYVSPPSLCVF